MSNKIHHRNGDPGANFQGRVERLIKDSTPWWPETPAQRVHGKPNIVVIYLDDLGFSDLGCYGGEIATPNIDALAAGGLRFANYTTVPMCSPARAALLTGKNPHSVGCGWIAHANPGFPGYSGEISQDAPTLAEILGAEGYSTMMVGKWHNTWGHNVHEAADKRSWPLQRGFNKFYGFMDAETSYFQPERLYEGNNPVDIDAYPDDHFATDDWTNRAIRWMKEHYASEPTQPFFLYTAFNAPHMPIQAKAQDIAKYKGHYNQGWDAFRQARFERQRAMGLLDERHKLAPLPPGVPAWNSLSAERQELFAKYMELYAGLVDNIDQNVGRIVNFLKQAGLLDNTIIVLSSDNGASAVGGLEGTPNYIDQREGQAINHGLALSMARDGRLGQDESMPAYPTGWAQVSNTPFRFFKRTPLNGGIRVPFVMHWPTKIKDAGAIRREWIHVTDITPTLLDILNIAHPDASHGFDARKPDGVSFAAMLDDGSAASQRSRQHYELEINRAYIDGHWKIASLQPRGGKIESLDNWMLFDLDVDPCETNNLAEQFPEKVAELAQAFDVDARANYVYPLDNRALERAVTIPPFLADSVNQKRTFFADTPSVAKVVVAPLLGDRNFTIRSKFDWQPGQQGVIFAIGEAFVGLVLYVMDDKLYFVFHRWMSPIELPGVNLKPGAQDVVLEYWAHAQRKGEGRLLVNGVEAVPLTAMSPTIIGIHVEGIDIGLDRRQRVSHRYAQHRTFPYSGTIDRVVIEPGAQAPGSIINSIEANIHRLRD
jgi:arylsulfatase A-like enzyme